MMNLQPRILVFDSGVGGLSIVKHIKTRLPSAHITFAADNAAFPYGEKSEDELIARIESVVGHLCQRAHYDIIVVGCNSASTIALPTLRSLLTQPVVGVVPAVKPAARLSDSKVIGLLATQGTVNRQYTDGLIQEFANDCTVIPVGSKALVGLAEEKLRNNPPSLTQLTSVLAPFSAHPRFPEMDTMVLACTHFPLLEADLKRVLPNITHWVDSGDAIARRVQFLVEEQRVMKAQTSLSDRRVESSITTPPHYQALFTAPPLKAEALMAQLGTWFCATWSLVDLPFSTAPPKENELACTDSACSELGFNEFGFRESDLDDGASQ
ncbi:glutamate racemase [Marinibactrum halimedae]|uniref:Glutamate racemase n=1 Tax=Marinibactrum halimedae TaxID=1444977 RepID=A0AA37T6H9_9GAMM|nr:glutamate racemase [Marinibactrum halimedae]MCD9460748.1 glutamate racemase [Marinibactrum halimedae]GLS26679.1 hypothetical protein GCM10007877_23960 [Marinibactrum halimedae]